MLFCRLHSLSSRPRPNEIAHIPCMDRWAPLGPNCATDNWGTCRPFEIKIWQTKTGDARRISFGSGLFDHPWMGKGDCGVFCGRE
jgi:hypothetical protein